MEWPCLSTRFARASAHQQRHEAGRPEGQGSTEPQPEALPSNPPHLLPSALSDCPTALDSTETLQEPIVEMPKP